jgi:hypothetical protein
MREIYMRILKKKGEEKMFFDDYVNHRDVKIRESLFLDYNMDL